MVTTNKDYLALDKEIKSHVVNNTFGFMYISVDGTIGFVSYDKYMPINKLFNHTRAVKGTMYKRIDDIHERYVIIEFSLTPSGEIVSNKRRFELG